MTIKSALSIQQINRQTVIFDGEAFGTICGSASKLGPRAGPAQAAEFLRK
ncbi:hypothetical protein JL100_015125 [Skermanella mucosa]|nr:hypothetical protein [Skermanella mucosa]UEM18457.1 hypothetical protein JL100_015125 [Skermanella mucosa]